MSNSKQPPNTPNAIYEDAKVKLDSSCALIVVDLQNDFLPNGGALGAPSGNCIIEPLYNIIKTFKRQGLTVYATRDWHPANHSSFNIHGGIWPVHCVQKSWGSQYPTGFPVDALDGEVRKGVVVEGDCYSGFDKTDLDLKLKERKIKKVFITGIATEYCVRATADDAHNNGYYVYILDDLIASVDAGDAVKAKDTMKAQGIHVIHSDQLIFPSSNTLLS
ncbi:hypothetical protein SeMB42_g01122 [Synchytrium endobioticum]|uniref:nicotinamidase n=1 Tax=Synchytrium endobioticum TaxID=286115 RepID=A0A507DNQ1_9FUNG|nr:hypothetical protein SeLEV6574_g04992 [Synchytrium endobioticum]TPX52875.1 hypothetical protein SeMB42_g01122 [Synchytrium endobioticum]